MLRPVEADARATRGNGRHQKRRHCNAKGNVATTTAGATQVPKMTSVRYWIACPATGCHSTVKLRSLASAGLVPKLMRRPAFSASRRALRAASGHGAYVHMRAGHTHGAGAPKNNSAHICHVSAKRGPAPPVLLGHGGVDAPSRRCVSCSVEVRHVQFDRFPPRCSP
jgi:hypothetical protein